MRTIVHMSDLHFGTQRRNIVAPLVEAIDAACPDLIAVSGDLTQRARRRQFIEASAFLDALPFPKLVVPGNHDVPLYNFYARFKSGLARYRKYVSPEIEPYYQDGEIAVLGINTARALAFKGGRINARQVAHVCERFAPLAGVVKILVSHHPFDLPQRYSERALVGRARMAMTEFMRCGIDLLLAGHHHVGLADPTALRFAMAGQSALLIQAGTATSERCRGELNSFNVIRVERRSVAVQRWVWQPSGSPTFLPRSNDLFHHGNDGWSRLP